MASTAVLLSRYMRPVNQVFLVPIPEPGDMRERNAFGYLKRFGRNYRQFYETQDARRECNEQAVNQVF